MDIFLKTTAGVLTALILCLCMNKQGKDFSILLSLAVCAMVIVAGLAFLKPIIDFFGQVQSTAGLDTSLLSVILRVLGVSMVAEVGVSVCKDAGNESMGKSLQIMASVVVLWMSIPVFEKLVSLLDDILGAL